MNVLNVSDIERELRRVASHATHPAARFWIEHVARNYLLEGIDAKDLASNFRVYNPRILKLELDMPRPEELPAWAVEALENKETIHWFDPIQVRRRSIWKALEYIVNWFNSWPPTDTRLNRLTRINFGTAATAASLWMSNVTSNLWSYVKDKPPKIKTYEQGYHWVKLVTNLHFERESKLMNHCIGNGNYYTMFKQGACEYYSLRDSANDPHCSVEVAVAHGSRTVKQCKGNSNTKPVAAYQKFIRRFFNDMQWHVAGGTPNID